MSQHLYVYLTEEQRLHLNSLIKKGNTAARVQTRARILLLADRNQTDRFNQQQIAQALDCCALTVSQVCRRFATEGIEVALAEKPRPGQAPKITGDIEARLITLACSDPPEGQGRWTLKLLADKLIELHLLDSISEVAVYNRLKKRAQTLAGKVLVHRKALRPVRSKNGGRPGGLRPSL